MVPTKIMVFALWLGFAAGFMLGTVVAWGITTQSPANWAVIEPWLFWISWIVLMSNTTIIIVLGLRGTHKPHA